MIDRRGLFVALVAVLVTVGVLGADSWAPPPESAPEPDTVAAVTEPVAGTLVCGVGGSSGDGELTLMSARSPAAGSGPAEVELAILDEGSVDRVELPTLFPGAAVDTTLTDLDDPLTFLQASWRGAPTTAWREWRVEGSDDLPEVTVAGPCAAPSSPRWIVPGMSTQGGEEARLRLSNPFGSAATVRIGFLTPDGIAEPLVLRNLTVPPRSVREIVVNETLPEEPDLAAIVDTSSGRMSVEGVQFARSAIGGIDGGSLLQAARAPAESWTIPWVSDGAASSSWLWIANPGERTAAVELTMHTPNGGELPTGLSEVSVPPGELRRVDLTGTFPEATPTVALTARSNGAPVVVSAGVSITSDDPASSGLAVQLGEPAPDRSWVVSGTEARDRLEQLHVSNPTGVDAVFDVTLFNGVASLEPEDLQGIDLSAGSGRVFDLREVLDERSGWTAFVTASAGEVVVGRLGRGNVEDQPLRLVAAPGIPSSAWSASSAGGSPFAVDEQDGLVRRLRTSAGPA